LRGVKGRYATRLGGKMTITIIESASLFEEGLILAMKTSKVIALMFFISDRV